MLPFLSSAFKKVVKKYIKKLSLGEECSLLSGGTDTLNVQLRKDCITLLTKLVGMLQEDNH